jgi:hypothetical protein
MNFLRIGRHTQPAAAVMIDREPLTLNKRESRKLWRKQICEGGSFRAVAVAPGAVARNREVSKQQGSVLKDDLEIRADRFPGV